jgi:predicted RNA-binding protein with RPS1 domain
VTPSKGPQRHGGSGASASTGASRVREDDRRKAKFARRLRLSQLKVGQRLRGRVRAVTDFGAFVDLHGIDGLVHVSELSADRVARPSDVVAVGDAVDVKIVEIDPTRERVSLSIKALALSPQAYFASRVKPGSALLGVIARISETAIEVRLAPDVATSVLVTDLPQDVTPADLDVGDQVWVRVQAVKGDELRVTTREVSTARADGAAQPMELTALRLWSALGVDAETASAWEAKAWTPKRAQPWIHEGIFDVGAAQAWAGTGLRPEELGPWLDLGPSVAPRWIAAGAAPDLARRWSHIKRPADASRWENAGFDPSHAEPWIKAGFGPDDAINWSPHVANPLDARLWKAAEVGPDVAGPWSATRVDTPTAIAWAKAGLAPADAVPWIHYRFTDRSAEPWIALEFTAEDAVAAQRAGMEPTDLVPWRDRGITVKRAIAWLRSRVDDTEAGLWSEAGLDDPTAAGAWKRRGWIPSDAGAWRAQGWAPKAATQWRAAGWTDPTEASLWRSNGWKAAEAMTAAARGKQATERTEAVMRQVPANFDPDLEVRARQQDDRLFGSPRTSADLGAWSRSATARLTVQSRKERGPAAAMSWIAPPRLVPKDVLILRALLERQASEPAWPSNIAGLVRSAVPVLVHAPEAEAKIYAEVPPADLEPDIRLPYPAMMVVFGASFELDHQHCAALPGWEPTRSDTSLPYEPWLAMAAERGGSLAGVVLFGGRDRAGLLNQCIWILLVDGTYRLVPSSRSTSALAHITTNLAAALCFGSWVKSPGLGQTRRKPGGTVRRSAPSPRPEVITVTIRPTQTHEKRASGPGSARASHLRRGHWHRYRVGPQHDWAYEWRWIAPTMVNGSIRPDAPDRVYRLPPSLFR